ncbi:hypothetical protein ACS0TY_010522 [Phlomoides rotata]
MSVRIALSLTDYSTTTRSQPPARSVPPSNLIGRINLTPFGYIFAENVGIAIINAAELESRAFVKALCNCHRIVLCTLKGGKKNRGYTAMSDVDIAIK